ncbi:unnamed protein product [Spirodela intermedia]|uniref:Cell division control protein n=1 Tax=Spirodela intermedia TaxID=51605 RepID=A0A7I8K5M8_SPIIN|nr:unnamed protein product [Spirodela intermedia]
MAKSPANRQGRKAAVAEPVGDFFNSEETKRRLNATPMPSGKRRRSDEPAPASPASPVSPEKWAPHLRRAASETDANGVIKTTNAVVTCCSPKSPMKRLFAGLSQKNRWNPRDPGQMNAVKEAFHVSSPPATIVCRDSEQMRIFEFCKTCIEQETGGSLYVCGCPGTGKTLSMERVKELLGAWTKEVGFQFPVTLSISCNSLTTTSEIFLKILEKCHLKKVNGASSPLQHLRDSFSQRKEPICERAVLVIMDELDYLITKDRAVLHDLFMLTTYPFSRFILIGIANAIDLADRFLPKLESLNCKPMVVTFRAYNKDQILKILQHRIMAIGYDVFEPLALEFCARKVAAASGDMRRALSVCLSAIEKFETELKCDTTGSKIEMVSFDHMDNALSKAFRAPVVDTIQSLPQHQQIILCALVRLLRSRKTSTVGDLNKSYLEVCRSAQVTAAGMMEFSSMCRVLTDQGLVKLGNSREEKLRTVALAIDGADVAFSLKGIRFFRHCLE